MKKKSMNLKERKEKHIGGFKVKRQKWEMM